MSEKITIGLLQLRSMRAASDAKTKGKNAGETPALQAEANLAHVSDKIREAAKRGAQIVCTHELFRSEYFCRREDADLFDLAEAVPGPTTDALAKVAKENKVAIVASLFERRAAGVYHNTCAVIDADGSFLGKYRKMHIPDDPLYYEKFYFTPGDLGFPNFDTRYGRIAVQICWDQWYPEGARAVSLGGAQVIFYPTSIGWHPREKAEFGAAQLDAWRTIQRGHAIANGVYVAVVNRVGFEGGLIPQARRSPERPSPGPREPSHSVDLGAPSGDTGIEFWGNSFVADPFGRVVAEASNDKEEVLVVECDPAQSEETRRNWPFLRDRRIDAYEPILNRWLGK
jgi:N-carbamoylputrescine amidase